MVFFYDKNVNFFIDLGVIHRICYVSKPLLSSQIDLLYINQQFIKWSVKSEVRRLFDKQRKYLNQAKNTKKTITPLNTQNQNLKNNDKKCLSLNHQPKIKDNKISNESITVEKILNDMIKTESSSDSEIGNLVIVEDTSDKNDLMVDLSSKTKLKTENNISKKKESNEETGKDDLIGDILSSMGFSKTEKSYAGLFIFF